MLFLLHIYNILIIIPVYSYAKNNEKNFKLNEENENFIYRNNVTFLDDEINNEIKSILNVADKFELFKKEDIIKSNKGIKCKSTKNQASIFFSSSITEHDIISFNGLKNATICSSCSNGYLTYFPAYKTKKIEKNSEPIADISCHIGQKLCICDYHNNCYIPNSHNISVMLYPACIRKHCNIYAILAGYERGDALVSLDNIRFFFSINQINFKTKEYWPFDTDGVYITVKSISCNGCNIKGCKRKKQPKKLHQKG